MNASKRLCKKCGKKIPNRVKIAGKVRNLQNRKFCLVCSPFQSHNTKPDDPSRPSKGRKYSRWDKTRKEQYKMTLLRRAYLRKKKLVEMAGGQCTICGYSKCQRALALHYRDSSQKEFPLSANFLWSKSWEKILKEFEKCDLICIRCLAELMDSVEGEKEKAFYSSLKLKS
jgi:hypothetical protein